MAHFSDEHYKYQIMLPTKSTDGVYLGHKNSSILCNSLGLQSQPSHLPPSTPHTMQHQRACTCFSLTVLFLNHSLRLLFAANSIMPYSICLLNLLSIFFLPLPAQFVTCYHFPSFNLVSLNNTALSMISMATLHEHP